MTLCWRKLEMIAGIKLHLIHVAGTRMIFQGSDGLSRGNLSEGVMRSEEMTSFIPLHLSGLKRSGILKAWIASWFGFKDTVPLENNDGRAKRYFLRAFSPGSKIVRGPPIYPAIRLTVIYGVESF